MGSDGGGGGGARSRFKKSVGASDLCWLAFQGCEIIVVSRLVRPFPPQLRNNSNAEGRGWLARLRL